MDILIKNMEMPKRCTGCFNSKCLLFFEHTDPNNSRHPNCPLVALPSHGRLCDLDLLIEHETYNIEQALFDSDEVLDDLKNTPVILEATE